MSVADYASRLRSDILDTPHVVSHSLGYEDRPPVAGIVRDSATFADWSALHFKEFLRLSPTITQLKYAYHYVAADGSLLFRYDNARDPVARHLASYPHHRHGPQELAPSSCPILKEVLREAASSVKRRRE